MKRRLSDVGATREGIFNAGMQAVSDLFPVANDAGSLEVENLHYVGDAPTTRDEKKAMQTGGSLGRDLRGDVILRDAEGNELDRRSRRIMRVPYLTKRGTFIYNGNDYAIPNQGHLRPGVYTRMGRTGKPQAPIQTAGGPNMKLQYEPSTGEFRLGIHSASLKLYPLLHAAGMDDETIAGYIGDAALKANRSNVDSRALSRVAKKITGETNTDRLGEKIRETFKEYRIDPGITRVTLGEDHDAVSPEMLAATARSLLDLYKGGQVSSRDAIYAQPVRTPEIQLKDQVATGVRSLSRRLWKAVRKGSLDAVPAGMLDNRASALFYEMGLAKPLEEYNPLEAFDEMQRITRGGVGGLSGHAVPEEARYVHPSQMGFLDPMRTPEGSSIGLDNRATMDTFVDDEGELYTIMENAHTGDTETVAARDVKDLTLSWPDQRGKAEPFSVVGGRQMRHVPADEVDYFLPNAESLVSDLSGLSPMVSTANAQRGLMSAKFALQSLPLTSGEAPLVQTMTSAGDTVESRLGKYAGVEHSPVGGSVTEVTPDAIRIQGDDGEEHAVELYSDFPLNRKTRLHQTPLVETGSRVEPGQMVAHSNFTDPQGTLRLGANMYTAYIPREENFEDAVIMREGAAREKFSANLMKQEEVDTSGDVEAGREAFLAHFPNQYEREQLDKIDDNGLVRPGETVGKGDPLILATGDPKRNPYFYAMRNTSNVGAIDESVTWDDDTEGRVVDSVMTKDGAKVFVETDTAAIEGDKWGSRYGGKGIITMLPDEEMPRDEDGRPLDLIISSLATTSRGNPGLEIEALLGKLAEHTGETVKMPLMADDDEAESFQEEAERRLKEAGLSPTADLYDPRTGKKIPEVTTGQVYSYRLTHTAKGKSKARGLAGHSAEGAPTTGGSEGGKRIGRQPLNALLSHGALDFIEETQKLKGAANPEVWNALRAGKDIKMPDIPYAHKKLFDLLRGAGIDVKRQGNNFHIMPLRDSEVEEMSSGAVESSDMLDRRTMRPVPGSKGLFDPALTGGPGGDRWSHLDLPTPLPNPVMQRPIARMIGIPQKGVREVVAGEREINGETGPGAIATALSGINVQREIQRTEKNMKNMSKTARDKAIKRLRHLQMLDKYEIDPTDLMISKVPVLPPKARPISELPGLEAPVMQSSNMLYKDLIDLRNAMRETELPEEDMGQFRGNLYDAVSAVYGLGEPVSKASKEKGLSGILKTVFGSSPKYSYLQQHVVSKPQEMSGLAVISPDNSLKLDQVGMPKSLAWDTYKPLVIRELVKGGMTPVSAMKEVRRKSKPAQEALKRAVEERPVIINRAPTLHRTGMMAMHPVLTDGETLRVPPPLVDTLGGDFDGDTMLFHVPVMQKSVEDVEEKMTPINGLISPRTGESIFNPTREAGALGLWLATRQPKDPRPPREFENKADAMRAMERGEIDPDQPVRIVG